MRDLSGFLVLFALQGARKQESFARDRTISGVLHFVACALQRLGEKNARSVIESLVTGHSAVMVLVAVTEHNEARPRAFASPDLGVERARASELRLRAMFDAEFDFVWRSLRRLGLDEGAADDATQETFVIAARKLDDVDLGRERSFLLGTAMRVAANVRRTRAFRDRREVAKVADDEARVLGAGGVAAVVVDEAPLPDEQVEQRQTLARLDRALSEMPNELREVIVLTELDALPHAEIAELLDIPIGTVASRLRRARRDLAAMMTAFESGAGDTTSGKGGVS